MKPECDLKKLHIYIAGKVSKDSVFGTHFWRDEFCNVLQKLSGKDMINLDPTKTDVDQSNIDQVFGADAYMISQADAVIVYLSDDISIGGSQEILIAKYFNKPVIGLAPLGGKFNGSSKEYFGKTVHNYRDAFVFTTCDIVCSDIEEVADALRVLESIQPIGIDVIEKRATKFRKNHLKDNDYLTDVLGKA